MFKDIRKLALVIGVLAGMQYKSAHAIDVAQGLCIGGGILLGLAAKGTSYCPPAKSNRIINIPAIIATLGTAAIAAGLKYAGDKFDQESHDDPKQFGYLVARLLSYPAFFFSSFFATITAGGEFWKDPKHSFFRR